MSKLVDLQLDTWLKPEEVKPEAVLVFIGAGAMGKIPGKDGQPDTPTFEIPVSLPNGDERIWTMNQTSQRAVAQSYGTKTDQWVGKVVTVYINEQNVRGNLRDVIYARVPKATPA